MKKYRIFKCKKDVCHCGKAWVISKGGFVVSMSSRYDWALEWTLEQIKKQVAA